MHNILLSILIGLSALANNPCKPAPFESSNPDLNKLWQHLDCNDDTTAGDPARNAVELRNALIIDPFHVQILHQMLNDSTVRAGELADSVLATREILPIMSRTGHDDVAYWLLLNSTTLSRLTHDTALNTHYLYNTVGQWLIQYAAGITHDDASPDYKHIVIHPHPDPDMHLMHLAMTYNSPAGKISSEWTIAPTTGTATLDVTIPQHAQARVDIPVWDGVNEEYHYVSQTVSAGTYQFVGTPDQMVENPPVLPLWTGKAPGQMGNSYEDIPTLTVYQAKTPNSKGTAMIVCPGGGYGGVSMAYEGWQAARYLNSIGVTAFVLKYRVAPYHYPVELEDVQRAIRYVRFHAAEWHIAPNALGIMGFSAGGHLAAMASTHADSGQANAPDSIDRVNSRPNFAVLVYPVISLTASWTHQGSKRNLLGDHPDSMLAQNLSNELAVTPNTPPTFLLSTTGDQTVPSENSVAYYLALKKAGVPAELHIFERGRHGLALAPNNFGLSEWPHLMTNWLKLEGWLP